MRSLVESFPARRTCRYSDCVNALDDHSNVCPHHSCEEEECVEAVGTSEHGPGLEDEDCMCWITCEKCRDFCGLEPLKDEDFPTTVQEVA